MTSFPIGTPGVQALRSASHNEVLIQREGSRYGTGIYTIDGAKSRDTGNTGDVGTLRGGTLLGTITSGGKRRPAVIGITGSASTNSSTSLTVAADLATELARLLAAGATTFVLTGPPTAGGTVRSATVTYSAASGTTLTHTAIGVNEVQTVTFPIASTGGSVALMLWDPRTSQYVQVPAAAWNATDATYLAAIQAKLDLAFGAANIVVVSAKAATDTDSALVFTYSGTGVAGTPCVDANGVAKLPIVTTLPTSSTSYATERTTSGVDGRFAAGSIIQPADGAATIKGISDATWGTRVLDGDGNSVSSVPCPRVLIGGDIRPASIPFYSSMDSAVKTWVKTALRAIGQFTFNDD